MFKVYQDAIVKDRMETIKQKKCMAERMCELYETKKHTDIEFEVGTDDCQVFHAHKIILAIGSPVFEAMFYGQFQECEKITVPDVIPTAFEAVLRFLYTDDVKLNSIQQVMFILYAARRYLIQPLEEKCVSYLSSELCSQNLCQIYETALMLDLPKLLKDCIGIWRDNATDILITKDFLNLDIETVRSLIKIPALNTLESNIFTAIYSWGKAECLRKDQDLSKSNIRKVVLPLLSDVWFLRMTPVEFVKHVINVDCLLIEESAFILVKLVNPDGNTTLTWPNHFTLSLNK